MESHVVVELLLLSRVQLDALFDRCPSADALCAIYSMLLDLISRTFHYQISTPKLISVFLSEI